MCPLHAGNPRRTSPWLWMRISLPGAFPWDKTFVRMESPAEASAEQMLRRAKQGHLRRVVTIGTWKIDYFRVLDPVVDRPDVKDGLDLAMFRLSHVSLALQNDFIDAVLQNQCLNGHWLLLADAPNSSDSLRLHLRIENRVDKVDSGRLAHVQSEGCLGNIHEEHPKSSCVSKCLESSRVATLT